MDQETIEFIEEREKKIGGKMEYRTYCTWYNDCNNNLRDRGVFLFVINNICYYEDFENQPTFFGILFKGNKRKNKKEFVKFYNSFSKDDIVKMGIVKKSKAEDCNIKKDANKFQEIFSQTVVYIKLKNDNVLFFEAMDKKQFIKELKGDKK